MIASITNGNYASFLGLIGDLVRKYLLELIPVIKEHIHQRRQCIRSTIAGDAAVLLAPETKVDKMYSVVTEVLGLTSTNQIGRFLVKSRSGNNFVIIIYNHDNYL